MKLPRWAAVSQSSFPWEREALDWVREHLPDRDPWRAWSNFEFIDDEGRVNEVDLLVLTPAGLVLVEVKSRPGTVAGDAHSWTWATDGRAYTADNPLPLANRKAKRLASLLRRQDAFAKGHKGAIPWIEPAIFLSGVQKAPRVDPGTARKVFLRGNPSSPDDPGLVGALLRAAETGLARGGNLDATTLRATGKAMEQAGTRSAGRSRQVGDYELGQLLTEGGNWQDFAATHASTGVARRVRVYPYARAASPDARERLGRAAQREFRVLEGVDHPGIARVLDYRESELGPALVFDWDPKAQRLDRYLAERLAALPLDARLGLLRQIAEAMGYAHGKRVHHRGLAPQNVLVRDPDGERPRLQVVNWQVASRGEGSGSASPGAAATTGTRHLDAYLSDPTMAYLAPESLSGEGGEGAGVLADVFSLGAIAYHLVTGRPPASGASDLPERLRADGGLRLSGAADGVGEWLEELVRSATAPVVQSRTRSVAEFLEGLSEAEKELRPPEARPVLADPGTAGPGDLLDGGFRVLQRLGRGSTADALLVAREGGGEDEPVVLKVAVDAAHVGRVRAEAEALRRLGHPNVVRFLGEAECSGRPGLLVARAGERTLGQWIRGTERPSLDLLRRFGENLLEAVRYLEEQGVAHRDIKPDNIGVAQAAGSGAYRLVLFDFSLSRTPPENLQAGTRPYLDPFLRAREARRWDLAAERYAAAVTLHEMLTGAPPRYGDGQSDPSVTDDEATVLVDRFDPALRDGLALFFSRALRRDAAARHGDAEEMLRAWRSAFAPLDRAAHEADAFALAVGSLSRQSPVALLGYGVEAQDVLHRMGVHTVQQLLGVPRVKLRYLRGVGERVRQEIRRRAKELAELRPELVPGAPAGSGGRASVDQLSELLLPSRPAGEDRPEDRVLAEYLGFDGGGFDGSGPDGGGEGAPASGAAGAAGGAGGAAPDRTGGAAWRSPGDVARRSGVARGAVAEVLEAARGRWHRHAELNGLRDELAGLLQKAGGVASADELALLLLSVRGSVAEDGQERARLAHAVLRAAVELEVGLEQPRFAAYPDAPPGRAPVLLATRPELAEYGRRLGRTADRLAAEEAPPGPARAEEELALEPPPNGLGLPPGRVLRLAAAASGSAALSARLEIYPRGMPAEGALRLSLGALAGPRKLTEEEVRDRVRSRYPEAAPLPPRPALDALLDRVGAERAWRDDLPDGPGYWAREAAGGTATGTAGLTRYHTTAAAPEPTADVLEARALEEKLSYAARSGAFLALLAEPHRAGQAEAELLRRFPRGRVSLERLVLRAMRAEAEARGAQWPRVLAADAAPRDGRDFQNLLRLAARAAPRVREGVLALREPALLLRPGLLARYGLVDVLQEFAQASGTREGPPSLWLLVPQSAPGLPRIDGTALPLLSGANWAWLTEAWLRNAHRARGGTLALPLLEEHIGAEGPAVAGLGRLEGGDHPLH